MKKNMEEVIKKPFYPVLSSIIEHSCEDAANIFGSSPMQVHNINGDKTRKREAVDARHSIAVCLAESRLNDMLVDEGLGRFAYSDLMAFFGLGHTMAIHSTKKIRNLYNTDKLFREKFDCLKNAVNIQISEHMISKKEEALHKEVATYLRHQYPKVMFNTDLSGVPLPMFTAKKVSGLRSEKGFPDIHILEPRNGYHGLFIELKHEGVNLYRKDGSFVSNEHIQHQAEVLDKLRQRGYKAEFSVGFDATKQLIDEYLKG